MSSRQIRKLQQQQELERAKLQNETKSDDESEEELELASAPGAKPSIFASLAEVDDSDGNKDAISDDEDVAEPEHSSTKEDAPPTTSQKKPKKGKKKKKGKGKGKINDVLKSTQDHPRANVDEIDIALKELSLQKTANTSDLETTPKFEPGYQKVCSLLSPSTYHLKVANEMRNLFGRTAVEVQDDAGGAENIVRRMQRRPQEMDLETALKGRHLPGKGLSEITLRRNLFIQGKEDWPNAPSGGLSMELVDDLRAVDGTIEFRYVHNNAYQNVQAMFRGYQQMGDPQNLIGLLMQNPYHISSLIQVSGIAKNQGDHALSIDLLERALFTFGRSASTFFTTHLFQGKARLDFARPENRELWLAGYHYIKSLIIKGTYRTALEWAKLLLSLDPEQDPYSIRLIIHHLALRAHEFEWHISLFKDSCILDIWDRGDGDSTDIIRPVIGSTIAFAMLQLKRPVECREALGGAMQSSPWLFCSLFKELSLDAPSPIWGKEPQTDAETLVTELYVRQTKDLWNTPEATSLLMEVAHTIPKNSTTKYYHIINTKVNLDIVRFVYLDNTPSLMALVPARLLHQPNNSDSDPLPPDSNLTSYPALGSLGGSHAEGDQARQANNNYNNPLAALARMILGDHELRRREAGDEEDEGDLELIRNMQAIIAADLEAGGGSDDESTRAGRLQGQDVGIDGDPNDATRNEASAGNQRWFPRGVLNMLGFGGTTVPPDSETSSDSHIEDDGE